MESKDGVIAKLRDDLGAKEAELRLTVNDLKVRLVTYFENYVELPRALIAWRYFRFH